MADEGSAALSPPETKNRKCGTCGRVLATEKDGILTPATMALATCDTCNEFESLYAAMGPADEAFEAIKHRNVNHGPRWNALKAAEKAHLALANFFLRVEGDEANCCIEELSPPDEDQTGNQKQGTKRLRSSTSTPGTPRSSKKLRLESGAKGISFHDSVIVREGSEYRGTGEFSRDSETYVRGRNAAPEGFEWVNSSGLGLAYGKFHGLKWRGRKWTNDPEINMDKMEDEEESESEAQTIAAEDDEKAGQLEEEDNITSPNAEQEPEKAATEPTQISAGNTERDFPRQPQNLVTEVEAETAEERSKENASPVTPNSKEKLVLPERPVSG
jgi:hypothetical protein